MDIEEKKEAPVKNAPPKKAPPKKKGPEKGYVWPDLVFKEYIASLVVIILLILWAYFVNAPLREIANPGITENPAKAPWYFLGLQELLVYFDPWIAGVVLPSIIITGLMVVPYVDINPAGNGGYTWKARKFAMINYIFGFVLWWVLIVIGVFLRGPDWNWYWFWESWDTHKEVSQTLDFQPAWCPYLVAAYLILGFVLPWLLSKNFLRKMGIVRYSIFMFHLLLMYFVPVKIVLRLFFNVRYALVTPWFNI